MCNRIAYETKEVRPDATPALTKLWITSTLSYAQCSEPCHVTGLELSAASAVVNASEDESY